MFGPEIIFIILGGLVAGAINALAGFGSIITLYILMEVIGLPPSIANGTNRVNVFANAFASTAGYAQNKKLKLKRTWPIIPHCDRWYDIRFILCYPN